MRGLKLYKFWLFIMKWSVIAIPIIVLGALIAEDGWSGLLKYNSNALLLIPILMIIWWAIMFIPRKILNDFIWLIERENARNGFYDDVEDDVVQEEDYETMELKQAIRDRKIKRLLMFIIPIGGIIITKIIIEEFLL
jgi:hypothetical protein